MRGSFVYHKNTELRKRCRIVCALTFVLILIICFLSSCGPEPGEKESTGQTNSSELFSDQRPGEGKGSEEGADSAAGTSSADENFSKGETAENGRTGADGMPRLPPGSDRDRCSVPGGAIPAWEPR